MTKAKRGQSHLADPGLSYKSVRFGSTPITPRVSRIDEQSTLSQFGFTPSSSANAGSKKKKRTLVPYGRKGLKRKRESLILGEPKEESAGENEEDEDERPVGKRRIAGSARQLIEPDSEEDKDNTTTKVEKDEENFLLKVDTDDEGADEESWRPSYAPKRRKKTAVKPKRHSDSYKKDRTLTQMYPLRNAISESEYEEESDDENLEQQEEQEEQEGELQEERIKEEDKPVRIKDEPSSQNEIPLEVPSSRHIKEEEEEPKSPIKLEEAEKENIPDEDMDIPTTTSSAIQPLDSSINPKTPKKSIPVIVPSSYTPPVTPLSPLRHSQLDAIYKSPSVQRLWRMKGIHMPGLSPVVEDQRKENDGTSTERTESGVPSPQQMLKRPDFAKGNVGTNTPAETSPEASNRRIPDFIKNKMVPSSQWWEREETWSSHSVHALETVLEVDSQPEVQVPSSDVPSIRSTTTTPKATPNASRVIEIGDVNIVPESPLKLKAQAGTASKDSFVGFSFREPLLRDSSGLHTISTSFLRKESSMVEHIPVAQNESQKSEVSTRSVDRQLIFESDDYNKVSAERVEETPPEKESMDPDATLSQTPSKDSERTPRAAVRNNSSPMATRKDNHIPLLPPSSPPQSYGHPAHVTETPTSSKDIFHSPSSVISTSLILNLTKRSSGFDQYSDGLSETMDSLDTYSRNKPVETLSQWKMRTFGPSQAVPTISQILPQSMLPGKSDDDDDDDEEL
ncbi:hypothetical protein ABW20_dc0100537 [Dactylellina cionopaga]|nr:hypothetical protein ABW20_dc0100537 [Dactylellina cionopaga]